LETVLNNLINMYTSNTFISRTCINVSILRAPI